MIVRYRCARQRCCRLSPQTIVSTRRTWITFVISLATPYRATLPRSCHVSAGLNSPPCRTSTGMTGYDSPVDEAVSFRMKRVRQRHTAPELVVRRLLFSRGYRYRLHGKELPGQPDIVFPGRRKVIFVHGCFWHGHQGCERATLPKTRTVYWRDKIQKNRDRDARAIIALRRLGWHVYIVWECELKSPIKLERCLSSFLEGET